MSWTSIHPSIQNRIHHQRKQKRQTQPSGFRSEFALWPARPSPLLRVPPWTPPPPPAGLGEATTIAVDRSRGLVGSCSGDWLGARSLRREQQGAAAGQSIGSVRVLHGCPSCARMMAGCTRQLRLVEAGHPPSSSRLPAPEVAAALSTGVWLPPYPLGGRAV